jgi:hypothetical protein
LPDTSRQSDGNALPQGAPHEKDQRPQGRQEVLTAMQQAAEARGLIAKTAQVEAGPVICVSGPKGEIACLVTETGFDVDAWADSIKARLA